MSVDAERELPETVVTVGGNSKLYHREDPTSGEPEPFCSAAGETFYRKDRETIESHYEPCTHCFPRAARTDG